MSSSQTCHVSQFELAGSGAFRFRIVCDMGLGELLYASGPFPEWVRERPFTPYAWRFSGSPNLDERAICRRFDQKDEEEWVRGRVWLTEGEMVYLRGLLTEENVEAMREMDEAWFLEHQQGICYRDGWSLAVRVDLEDGRPSVVQWGLVTGTSMRSEEGTPMERLERWCIGRLKGRLL